LSYPPWVSRGSPPPPTRFCAIPYAFLVPRMCYVLDWLIGYLGPVLPFNVVIFVFPPTPPFYSPPNIHKLFYDTFFLIGTTPPLRFPFFPPFRSYSAFFYSTPVSLSSFLFLVKQCYFSGIFLSSSSALVFPFLSSYSTLPQLNPYDPESVALLLIEQRPAPLIS